MAEAVVLVTDYGTSDHYAASLVGSCLRVAAGLRIEHGTHGVPFGDVLAGAFRLCMLSNDFPAGTVFCGVVDPGVGTSRGALAIEAGGVRCVAPDTGLVHWLWDDAPQQARSAVRLAIPSDAAPTFHGRDLFAPVAARLATGATLADVGEPLAAPRLLDSARIVAEGAELVCRVVVIDHFGNVVTTLRRRDLGGARLRGASWQGGSTARVARTFAEIGDGVALVVGGGGHVGLSADSQSAADLTRLKPGDAVRVQVER
jgi:S-adenosyl-L-methionine hydrolase (adenosine-forming)